MCIIMKKEKKKAGTDMLSINTVCEQNPKSNGRTLNKGKTWPEKFNARNSLPESVKEAFTLAMFKSRLKTVVSLHMTTRGILSALLILKEQFCFTDYVCFL